MARIAVLGGTGYAGSNIAHEAAARGHEVTSVSRSMPAETLPTVAYVTGDVTDEAFAANAVQGAEIVIVALSPRADMQGRVREAIAGIVSHVQVSGARVGVTGGAGSLLVAPGGPRLVDTDAFPAEFKTEANEMAGVLADLRELDTSLDWFFVSPAAAFGGFNPGTKTGTYRLGNDVLLVDDNGDSFVSGADFAKAIVDEIEQPAHHRARFTIAY